MKALGKNEKISGLLKTISLPYCCVKINEKKRKIFSKNKKINKIKNIKKVEGK